MNSDKIGCMSRANVNYIDNNKDLSNEKLEVYSNAIDVIRRESFAKDDKILEKYNISQNMYLLLGGHNLGKT